MKRILTIAFLTVMTWSQASAGSSKIARDLQNRDPNSTVDVIVQYNNAPTEKHHQKVRDQGGSYKGGLDAVKGALYSLPAAAIQRLADDPDVAYLAADRAVGASAYEYAPPAVNGDIAWKYG